VITNNLNILKTMKRQLATLAVLLIVFMLSSCGGSNGGATGGPNTPTNPPSNGFVLTMTPVVSSLPANTIGYPIFLGSPFITQLEVLVKFSNGNIAPDGTSVNLSSNNVDIGFLSILDDPDTTEVNEFTNGFGTIFTETTGGKAIFFIHSGATAGSVTFTASASSEGRSYTNTLLFTVSEGPNPSVQQIEGVTSHNSLPANVNNVEFFNGTPFMTEVDVQVRDVFGNVTNPAFNEGAGAAIVTVSISPANAMYFTVNDNPATPINEFIEPQQTQGFIEMVNGHGNLFLWSKDIPANVTVSISAIEAGSGRELSSSVLIDVVDGGSNSALPSSISLLDSNKALYVNGSGGATAQNVSVSLKGGSLPVNDPQVNNVRLSITTDAGNSGEKLTGVNVSGATVQGSSISVATTNGIATASVQSGTNPNTIFVTATTDKADNNVDNGIQDALTTVTQYVVSDGRLWSLKLTTPTLNALTVNGPQTFDIDGNPIVDDNGFPVLEYQDGSYSLIISAIGTDKGGNPALPQTVQFGMINSPISGYPLNGAGSFVHSSTDGDPQEGGSSFTSNSASFITAAGGVQPNDTLVVFGEESLGNEDLESAVTVSSVNSQNNLTILERFNRNDESGTVNNDFGILPYAIGRAVDGNIEATAILDANGLATTRINYPVSQLGRIAAVYVKGQGPVTNGVVKSITDVDLTAFPGVEGYQGNQSTMIVSPNIIPANTGNISFDVCLLDSARNPLSGRHVAFNYLGIGNGTIDGQLNSGVMIQATGSDGCATGVLSTSGIISNIVTGETGFNFSSGGLTCETATNNSNSIVCIEVGSTSGGVLNANPSAFFGRGNVPIVLTLYDGGGQIVAGAPIQGECDLVSGGILSIISGPSVTDSNGQSFVTVSVGLDAPMAGLSGTCTFTTADGGISTVVNFAGGDACLISGASPVPPSGACPP